jgi:hypothetical protein
MVSAFSRLALTLIRNDASMTWFLQQNLNGAPLSTLDAFASKTTSCLALETAPGRHAARQFRMMFFGGTMAVYAISKTARVRSNASPLYPTRYWPDNCNQKGMDNLRGLEETTLNLQSTKVR